MIRQKINLMRALIFAAQLLLSISATPTELPIPATLASNKPTIDGIPTGIFTVAPQIYTTQSDQGSAAAAYDDFDDYVPFRSDTHDYFSWELLKEVLQGEQQNVVISPFSVKLVLALLSEASGNNTQTQKELRSTQTDIKSPENLRSFYRKILISLKKENPYHTLLLETKLYTDEFIAVNQPYASSLEYNYDTKVERLNFTDSQSAAQRINAWCSNVTKGHLQQLVNPDGIQNTVMLMANAIYFNGLWRRQFNDTFEGVFLKTPTEQLKMTYMEQIEYFYYYDSYDMDAKILRLPYKGKKFSMFILLPKTKFGVESLTRNLENGQLKNMQFLMEEVKVKVTMPKFKFEFNKNLKESLQHLGIQDIFTENASLPGLARGAAVAGKLKVSNIYQKAGIDVNERGTEAFAATVVEIENKFGGSDAIQEFNVNRPFIFFIEEEATGNIIFAGKVIEPFV